MSSLTFDVYFSHDSTYFKKFLFYNIRGHILDCFQYVS